MGYRSEVQCLIYGPVAQIDGLVARLALTNEITPNPFVAFAEDITFEDRNVEVYIAGGVSALVTYRFICLHGFSWKWYSSYEDVVAWTALMSLIDDDEVLPDLYYEFVRIGENSGDIELSASADCFNYLNVRSSIYSTLDEETTPVEETK